MMVIIIIKIYAIMIPQWYESDTPLTICDAQNLNKTLCVSLFELENCFDVFEHHIK